MSLNSEIFVDKSELLDVTNRYVCQSSEAFWKVNGSRYAGSLL